MRFTVVVTALILATAPAFEAAFAQGRPEARPAPDAPKDAPKPPRKPASLDELFTRLAAAKDATEANGVASLIERRWARSGSDTADLLMSRAEEAMKAKEFPLSVELLDRVLALRPEWAEAWHRRATAFFLLDDPVSAIADLNRVVAKEPRHFGAWAGLGHIYMAGGDKRQALAAYRKALAIHPYLAKLRDVVERLGPEIDGRDI